MPQVPGCAGLDDLAAPPARDAPGFDVGRPLCAGAAVLGSVALGVAFDCALSGCHVHRLVPRTTSCHAVRMADVSVSGYGVVASLVGGVLTVRGTSGPGWSALQGGYAAQDAGASVVEMGDLAGARAEAKRLRRADVVIPLDQVAGVSFRGANALVNGCLTVTTAAGRKYQLHFRRKQASEWEALRDALPHE